MKTTNVNCVLKNKETNEMVHNKTNKLLVNSAEQSKACMI